MSEIRDVDLQNARLAYTIIQSLFEHNGALSDLVALMARVIDEDTQRALTNTPQWNAYLDSRRALDTTRLQIEKFTEELKKLEDEAAAENR
ncbi:MAG TPA: hypothetical protein VEX64_03990 [Pyrinomonadaceae bacterium]|jgi:hypothetical protein|nr:hypothetical protein [Pyrinomonadaceae bacterium]